MPHVENTQLNNNYTLTKLIRTGTAPLNAMIGISSYYGQLLNNPILGSINSLLFAKKLGIDIWNLNQRLNFKTRLLNSSKKILLGLGTISFINYSKFINNEITPIEPTTTISPITTTTIDPFPPNLMLSLNNNLLIDWDTYGSLTAYGIANLISGITELIPNKFETIRKISNMSTGGCLISTGVAMGIHNNFDNAYAVPTIVAGASEIIHNLLPLEITHDNTEMQETIFSEENRPLFSIATPTESEVDYGSINHDYDVSMSDVVVDDNASTLSYDNMFQL